MTPLQGTEGLPPHLQTFAVIVFLISVGIIQAIGFTRGKKAEKKALEESDSSAAKTAGKMLVLNGATHQMTQDVVVDLLGQVKALLLRIDARMDAEEKQEQMEEMEKRMYQRLRDEIKSGSS